MGAVGQVYHTNQIHYLRKDFAHDTAGGAAGTLSVGVLPAGSVVLEAAIVIREVFDGTPAVLIGISTNDDLFIDANDVDETALGFTGAIVTGAGYYAAETPVVAKVTQTAGTTGEATVIISYVPA